MTVASLDLISWTLGCKSLRVSLCLSTDVLLRDAANGGNKVNNSATLEYMKNTFMDHYNGKRQPIGLYTHPIHLAVRVIWGISTQ